MPAGRPSKITERVLFPLFDGYGPPLELPITEAICRLLREGCYPTNAAKACGISESTFANWLRYGGEWDDVPLDEVPEDRRVFVQFLGDATRAEAEGLAWHERNVRTSAAERRDRDGRLSLEFLARRQPKVYSKRVEVKHDTADRRPSNFDADLAKRADKSFLSAALPEGLTPDDFLPPLEEDAVEAGAGVEE